MVDGSTVQLLREQEKLAGAVVGVGAAAFVGVGVGPDDAVQTEQLGEQPPVESQTQVPLELVDPLHVWVPDWPPEVVQP